MLSNRRRRWPNIKKTMSRVSFIISQFSQERKQVMEQFLQLRHEYLISFRFHFVLIKSGIVNAIPILLGITIEIGNPEINVLMHPRNSR